MLAFLEEHCPGIDEVEDYPVVQDMMTRLLATHQARRDSWTPPGVDTWSMPEFGDPEREHTVLAE
ncbi:hypothetical protein ACFQ0M_05185 [Kitasatospora aburaviensis]